MNTVKRLFVSIKHQIDSVAEDLEDHQALVNSAIAELDSAGAETQIQLNQKRHQIHSLQQQQQGAEKDAVLWGERAVQVRTTDEGKALDCVKRMQALHQQTQQLTEQIEQAYELERQLMADLEAIKNKRHELNARKDTIRARENRSYASRLVAGSENPVTTADKVLERWESRVVADEYYSEQQTASKSAEKLDPLQQQFEQSEDQQSLRAALDQLMPDQSDHNQ